MSKENMIFESGDVVVLKSGGPAMTVRHLLNYPATAQSSMGVLCDWMDNKGRHKQASFAIDQVTLIKEKEIEGA